MVCFKVSTPDFTKLSVITGMIALAIAMAPSPSYAKKIPALPATPNSGTETSLKPTDISDLMGWSEETKVALDFAQNNYQTFSKRKHADYLRGVIQDVLAKSQNKPNELFVRYSLARAYEIARAIENNGVGKRKFATTVLLIGIDIAKKYYQSDIDYLKQLQEGNNITPNYAAFGNELAIRMAYLLCHERLNPKTKYDCYRLLASWYGNDLNKDKKRRDYATNIALINNVLNTTQPNFNGYKKASHIVLSMLVNVLEQVPASERCGDLKIGEEIYGVNNEGQAWPGVIIGCESSGYAVRFSDGDVLSAYSRQNIAKTTGCNEHFCVGKKALNRDRDNRKVKIVGILPDGKLVLYYYDVGGNPAGRWSTSALVLIQD